MSQRLIKFCLLLWVGSVEAAPQPQSIEFGGGNLIPTLSVTTESNDNIFNQPTNEESDTITKVNPRVQWLQQKDTTSMAVTYTGNYGLYWDSSDDNYQDHTLSFDAIFAASDFVGVTAGASYGWLHDNRGEGSSEGINALTRPDPDEYEIRRIDAQIDLGRQDAAVGFRILAYQEDVEYQNNRNETIFRDRDESRLTGRFYYRLSGGKTKLFAQLSEKEITYDEDPLIGGKLDSEESGYSAGVEWEATAKTTGSFRVGKVDKDFDSVARDGDKVNSWEAEVTWEPRSYSTVILNANKSPQETNGTGDFIDAREVSVVWIHKWSNVLSSVFTVGQGSDNYGNSTRVDDRDSVSIAFNYDWRRWMTVGARYSFMERDSNQDTFDFDRNVFLVSVDMSL